jgi:hypothetical protein
VIKINKGKEIRELSEMELEHTIISKKVNFYCPTILKEGISNGILEEFVLY